MEFFIQRIWQKEINFFLLRIKQKQIALNTKFIGSIRLIRCLKFYQPCCLTIRWYSNFGFAKLTSSPSL